MISCFFKAWDFCDEKGVMLSPMFLTILQRKSKGSSVQRL